MSQKSKPQEDIKRTILTDVLDDVLDKVLQPMDANENDKIEETIRCAEVTQNANLNMDSDIENVGVPPIEDIEKAIITAVHHLGNPSGASLDDIKCHLFTTTNNIFDSENIQLSLNNAVDKGLLSKLTNGKRKIKKPEKRVEEIFPKPKSAVDKELQSTLANGKDKRKETAICSDIAAQHANAKTGPEPGNVGVPAATSIEEAIMTTVCHLGSSNDVCLDDIERLWFSILSNASALENIRLSLNNVDGGLRSKLTNGKYKIIKTEKGEEEIIQDTKSTADEGHQSTASNGKDKFRETTRYSEVAQQTNVKAGLDPGNVPAATTDSDSDLDSENEDVSAEEGDASVSDEKIKTIKTTTIKKIKTTTIKTITTTTIKTTTTTTNKKTRKPTGKVENV